MPGIQLNDRQHATVAAALTVLGGIVIVSFVGGILYLAGHFINRFSSILLPLAVAGVLALVLKPYHQWLTNRVRGRRLLAVFLVFLSILLPVVLFGALFGAKVVEEGTQFASSVPGWVDALQVRVERNLPAVQAFWEKHNLTFQLKDGLANHGTLIARSIAGVTGYALEAWGSAFRSVAGLLSWFILPVYLGFFLLGKTVSRGQFEELLPFLKPSTRQDVSYLVFEFVEILVSFFRGQMVIALCQGVLFAVGFVIVGLDYGFTLGLALGFLNVIPYLGSIVGLSIGLPLAFFQDGGGLPTAVLVLVVFTIVQCIEGYILTPKIMGDRTGLHPLVIIIAIFFWGSVFGGITGMILAIPLTAFLVVFWRLLKVKYIKEVM